MKNSKLKLKIEIMTIFRIPEVLIHLFGVSVRLALALDISDNNKRIIPKMSLT